ncbi:hypothetical protein PHAMO_470070 [Magnetospirillum molischianum DSM 120]|uniref:Uncharacterized protein n=1 Tax=Magnetospirillum molischianum DSM 120 TaxID=1150626 RepID=H8FWT1_MAGML|nr:hypothetical protein PHAMO_470070 [Magnetospirillum molischianum DSM 120]
MRSVELERLIEQGLGLIERRNAFEFFRDTAADRYEAVTGSSWRPRVGSMVNHRALTVAVIDSRDFIAARHRADPQLLLPPGVRIAFTGGAEWQRPSPYLGRARPRPGQASRHGAAARRQSEGRRADRRLLGRLAQGGAGGVQAGLDPAQERRPLQAQRPDARGAADRPDCLPRLRHQRKPRRQGPKARHPGMEVRLRGRRVSAASGRSGRLRRGLAMAKLGLRRNVSSPMGK